MMLIGIEGSKAGDKMVNNTVLISLLFSTGDR